LNDVFLFCPSSTFWLVKSLNCFECIEYEKCEWYKLCVRRYIVYTKRLGKYNSGSWYEFHFYFKINYDTHYTLLTRTHNLYYKLAIINKHKCNTVLTRKENILFCIQCVNVNLWLGSKRANLIFYNFWQ